MAEPKYTAAEIRQRRKEVRQLCEQAVKSWDADKTGKTALVVMTFEQYCILRDNAKPSRTR